MYFEMNMQIKHAKIDSLSYYFFLFTCFQCKLLLWIRSQINQNSCDFCKGEHFLVIENKTLKINQTCFRTTLQFTLKLKWFSSHFIKMKQSVDGFCKIKFQTSHNFIFKNIIILNLTQPLMYIRLHNASVANAAQQTF